jgi:predicted nucleic acid-binding protein
MRGDKVFVDTNVLLYSHDVHDPAKAARAKEWLQGLAASGAGVCNMQVLNEMTAVLLRKRGTLAVEDVFGVVDLYSVFGDTPVTRIEMHRARELHVRTRYSWWDCLLLAAAQELGCRWFLSEDLGDGHEIEGLTIIDPFAHSPEQITFSR